MTPIFAYLDPATGTLIVSAIVGGFAAGAMVIKRFWYRIKAVFTGTEPSSTTTTSLTDAPSDEA